MYKVISDGHEQYSDTIVYIKLAGNGCYIPCDRSEAAGVCAKLPTEYKDDDGNIMQAALDTVFSIDGGELHGDEPEAELQEITGSLLLYEALSTLSEAGAALTEGVESIG